MVDGGTASIALTSGALMAASGLIAVTLVQRHGRAPVSVGIVTQKAPF